MLRVGGDYFWIFYARNVIFIGPSIRKGVGCHCEQYLHFGCIFLLVDLVVILIRPSMCTRCWF